MLDALINRLFSINMYGNESASAKDIIISDMFFIKFPSG